MRSPSVSPRRSCVGPIPRSVRTSAGRCASAVRHPPGRGSPSRPAGRPPIRRSPGQSHRVRRGECRWVCNRWRSAGSTPAGTSWASWGYYEHMPIIKSREAFGTGTAGRGC